MVHHRVHILNDILRTKLNFILIFPCIVDNQYATLKNAIYSSLDVYIYAM